MKIDLADVPSEYRTAVSAALEAAGVDEGHLAVEIVDETRIHELNRQFRDRDKPTDVLSFPVDEDGPTAGPRELGDVIVCPEFCSDVTEAVVHGVLHLCGHDHETDTGEMFEVQDRIMEKLHV
ncbi:MAG: rRNA maturation RNase YbeY [Actinomycetota bacterium]|nr:rRNA maturation RNase YbeY [Actinomycetota bacterium]